MEKWNVKMEVHVLLLEKNSSAFALQHSKEHIVKKVFFQLLFSVEYMNILQLQMDYQIQKLG